MDQTPIACVERELEGQMKLELIKTSSLLWTLTVQSTTVNTSCQNLDIEDPR
jgi:hypothetical protein